MPESFEKARNDGERWRWALAQAVETDPGLLNTVRTSLAGFLLRQFGTQTMSGQDVWPRCRVAARSHRPVCPRHLKDDETIARLASGIKRFKLPDEFNPIKIYQAIADEPKTGQGEERSARWLRSSRIAASSTGPPII